jgi:hypothetical protein
MSVQFPSRDFPGSTLRWGPGVTYDARCPICQTPMSTQLPDPDSPGSSTMLECVTCRRGYRVQLRYKETSLGAYEVSVVGVSSV